MLYIWPFFAFFSFPMLYPYLIEAFVPQKFLPRAFQSATPVRPSEIRPRFAVAAAFIAIMLVAVHVNTITHPFTLADNRHYIFYVFRWFLLRNSLNKYLATPIYFVCGWAAIRTLGGRASRATSAISKSGPIRPAQGVESHRPEGNKISFVIVWLASTNLALISVPLVEPRYFILPWIMWRLHVPPSSSPLEEWFRLHVWGRWTKGIPGDLHRLGLETLWFMCVNWLTGYVFLHKGFEWPQEPGIVQRFMW